MNTLRMLTVGTVFPALVLLGRLSLADSTWKLPPETAKFKSAPGSDTATAACVLCHSVDYISTQPPLDRTGWQAIVQKMREKYGAPIPTNKVDEIVLYLSANYGKLSRNNP